MKDYVLYGDTDSLFCDIASFLDYNVGLDWRMLKEDVIIHYIRKISAILTDHVNDRSYREVQRKHYNCGEEDFRIKFKQEIIAKSALFVMKKKYSLWCVDEEGIPTDKMKTTGLEIVRSETPQAVKPRLRTIMEMILKGATDVDISNIVEKYKTELYNVLPEEIAVNVGISHIDKYNTSGEAAKGTPWHVKGALNYGFLLKELKLEGQYDGIQEGNKAKVVYLKKNIYKFDSLSFLRWPKEFDGILKVDYQKMVDKHFISKIETLLTPMGKEQLLNFVAQAGLDAFF